PLLEPVGRVVEHLLDLGNLLRLLLGQRKAEVEGEVAVVGGDVGELPAHPPLVGGQPLDRSPREAQQRHVAGSISVYTLLDKGTATAGDVFSTDPQLPGGTYTVLTDTK